MKNGFELLKYRQKSFFWDGIEMKIADVRVPYMHDVVKIAFSDEVRFLTR
jgi:hypothetical protein